MGGEDDNDDEDDDDDELMLLADARWALEVFLRLAMWWDTLDIVRMDLLSGSGAHTGWHLNELYIASLCVPFNDIH